MSAPAIEFDLRITPGDERALFAAMQKQARYLNVPLGRAVQNAAAAVVSALRATTKASPKHRPITPTGRTNPGTGNREFEVESWVGGTRKTFAVWAANKTSARRLPQVRIGRRGLAKRTWQASGRGLGSLGPGTMSVAGRTDAIARRLGTNRRRTRGEDPYVQITNRLPYAMSAFETDGPRTIDNALARAARRMEHIMDQQLIRRMGAR